MRKWWTFHAESGETISGPYRRRYEALNSAQREMAEHKERTGERLRLGVTPKTVREVEDEVNAV